MKLHKTNTTFFLILLMVFSSCTDFFASLDKHKEWVVTEIGNVILHTRPEEYSNSQSPDEHTISTILRNQNFYCTLIKDTLGLQYDEKVLIYLFNQDEALEAIGTNTGGYSISERSTIYYTFLLASYKDVYNRNVFIGCHELVNLLTHRALGNNYSRMMNEGYAVAIAGSYGRTYDEVEEIVTARTINDWMQFHYMNNNILTPHQLLFETDKADEIFCPNAGFFISFLWQNYDISKVNMLFNLSGEDIHSMIAVVLGKPFEEISEDYMNFVELNFEMQQ